MNEKQMEIAQQYDMDVKKTFRSRGCLHLDTEQGLFMIVPYYGSPLRLACELELQKKLEAEGFDRLDRILPNKENGLITYDKYRSPFVVKKAYEGRECSLKEEKEVEAGAQNLGCFHKITEKFKDYQVEKRDTPPIYQMIRARKQELKRVRGFIKKSGRRTDFELVFSSCYEEFYEEAERAFCLAESREKEFWEKGFGICHGSYHQHNILMGEEGIVTLNLGQFHYNQQILDLYHFMRKALEKNHYQKRVYEAALSGYEKERRLEPEEYLLLQLLFSFPEKFWKISNQYYNGKKCWMPPKNLEKLKKTIEQNGCRKRFISQTFGTHFMNEKK